MRIPQLSVILPTYNESGNIVRLIKTIQRVCRQKKITTEIIVVDDNSPDKTAGLVRENFSRQLVKVIVRRNERGLANAIKYGIKLIRGQHVVIMDTDFNHNPKEIISMYTFIKKARLVIGSRYIQGGGMENRLRHHLSWAFNLYLKLLLGHGINDNLSGYFIMKRTDLLSLPLDEIFYGFGDYFIRLVFIVNQKNWSIMETPVFYQNRVWGVSKSRFVHMFITYTITALRLRFGMIGT